MKTKNLDFFKELLDKDDKFTISKESANALALFSSFIKDSGVITCADFKIHGEKAELSELKLNRKDAESLMGKGNGIIETFAFLGSNKENRESFDYVGEDIQQVSEVELKSRFSDFGAFLLNYLITDNAKKDSKRVLPAFIRSITNYRLYNELHDNMTKLEDVEPIMKDIITKLTFDKIPPKTKLRLKLGFAGHRFINIFCKVALAKGISIVDGEVELAKYTGDRGILDEDSRKDFISNVFKIEEVKPCKILHSAFKPDNLESIGSINKGLVSFLVNNKISTVPSIDRSHMKNTPIKYKLLSEEELKAFVTAFNGKSQDIIKSSLRIELT